MKLVLLISFIFLSVLSFAQEIQDLSKMLEDSNCVPVRGADGDVSSIKCDGPLGEEMKKGNVQNLESPNEKTMTLYSQLKNTNIEAKGQSVKMTMVISFDEKIVSKPQIITHLNSLASISQKSDGAQKELLIEVLPSLETKNNQNGILMKFRIGQKENGQFKWLSTPQIFAKNNQEAEFKVQSNNPNDEYKSISLKVLPVIQ